MKNRIFFFLDDTIFFAIVIASNLLFEYIIDMQKVARVARKIRLEDMKEEPSSLTPAENIVFTWELSQEAYALAGKLDAESGFQ